MRTSLFLFVILLSASFAFATEPTLAVKPNVTMKAKPKATAEQYKHEVNVTKEHMNYDAPISTTAAFQKAEAITDDKGVWFLSFDIKNTGTGVYLEKDRSIHCTPSPIGAPLPFRIQEGQTKNVKINIGTWYFDDNQLLTCRLTKVTSLPETVETTLHMPRLNNKLKITEAYYNKTSKRWKAVVQNTSQYDLYVQGSAYILRNADTGEWTGVSHNHSKVIKAQKTETIYGTVSTHIDSYKKFRINMSIKNSKAEWAEKIIDI